MRCLQLKLHVSKLLTAPTRHASHPLRFLPLARVKGPSASNSATSQILFRVARHVFLRQLTSTANFVQLSTRSLASRSRNAICGSCLVDFTASIPPSDHLHYGVKVASHRCSSRWPKGRLRQLSRLLSMPCVHAVALSICTNRVFSSLAPSDIPFKLRCAVCNKLATDAFKLPCCDQSLCSNCTSKSSFGLSQVR